MLLKHTWSNRFIWIRQPFLTKGSAETFILKLIALPASAYPPWKVTSEWDGIQQPKKRAGPRGEAAFLQHCTLANHSQDSCRQSSETQLDKWAGYLTFVGKWKALVLRQWKENRAEVAFAAAWGEMRLRTTAYIFVSKNSRWGLNSCWGMRGSMTLAPVTPTYQNLACLNKHYALYQAENLARKKKITRMCFKNYS